MLDYATIREHFGAKSISTSPAKTLTTEAPVRRNNNRVGVLMMLCAMFLFAGADTISKILTDAFHPVQIIWFRQSGLLAGVLVVLLIKGTSILKSAQPSLQILRGSLVVFSSVAFVFALRYVELADAVAASFVAPFFVTILGALVLKEKVGVRRWSAVIVGFIGALIIIRPGMGVIHPTVLLVVFAAACFSTRQVIGRLLADTDRTITTIAYTALSASLLLSIALPFVWQMPTTAAHWMMLLGIGVLGGVAEVLVIKSMEICEAVVLAPIHYTIIIWATVYGYVIFHELPDHWTLLGTAIIVAAGLYTLQRSKR